MHLSKMNPNFDKVVFIYNNYLIKECDRLPFILKRATMVQDLINAYKLLLDDKFLVVESLPATEDELKLFHSGVYIDFIKKTNACNYEDEYEEEKNEFGLEYDCPLIPRLYTLIRLLAGSSISAAKLLVAKKCRVAINWFGGWHHAQRDSAEGFCYVNDVVIAIQYLSKSFNKILYIDLDIHHGNGVQNAFEFSNRILTLSFHKKQYGFYPGTGAVNEIGKSKGTYHSLNVPFLTGIGHNNYMKLFNEIFNCVYSSFQPSCIVVQCGADGLNGDPIGQCNLTLRTFGECVKGILNCSLPTLFLGGGGYNFANTARLWTYLTSVIADINLDNDIPDDSEYFPKYGPSYELHIDPSLQKDENNEQYIKKIIDEIKLYCCFIS